MTIKQLESELQELKELCEEQSSEILSLKDTIQNFKGIGNKYESEIEELKKEIDELSQQPAITQDDFELLDRVREENQAMRQLLKLWM
jgi:uncharacterized coiled-coil DUF342 family protein